MKTQILTCILAGSLLAACQTAPTAANNGARRANLTTRLLAQNDTVPNSPGEPMPPAEGPEDVPVTRSVDPARNPSLLPTPLLRTNAASGL